MSNPVFVLVQGAWEGGWYWRFVVERLRARGHEVFAPSLTGLGDRAHLLTPSVDLSTHIADIVGVIRCHELENVVLAGHSYGGMVISGVAAQLPEPIRALVYLDAFVPENGQCTLDLVSPERRAQFEAAAAERGEGWRIPPIPAKGWGIDDPDHGDWLDRLSTDQPLAAMRQPVALTGAEARIPRRVYVHASGYDPSPFRKFADALADDPGWTLLSINSHHFIMFSHPDEVTEILVSAADA